MLEVKWICEKCKHEQKGYCDGFFEIDTSKNDYDVDGFCLKCEKCKKDASFELVITDLQGIEL